MEDQKQDNSLKDTTSELQKLTQEQKDNLDKLQKDFQAIKPKYETKYAELSNGEKIGYRDVGNNEDYVVVMIHGNFTCSLYYEPIIKQLSNMFRCIAPCLRGFGYSSYNKPITSLKDCAADIQLLINDHLKLKKFYLFAHSMGTLVATHLANLFPDQVSGIIFLSGFSPSIGWTVSEIKQTDDFKEFYNDPIWRSCSDMAINMDYDWMINGFGSKTGLPQDLPKKAIYKSFCLQGSIKIIDWSGFLAQKESVYEEIKKLKPPVKVINGIDDQLTPVDNLIEWSALLGKQVSTSGVEGASHFPLEQKTETVVRLILNFIMNTETKF